MLQRVQSEVATLKQDLAPVGRVTREGRGEEVTWEGSGGRVAQAPEGHNRDAEVRGRRHKCNSN